MLQLSLFVESLDQLEEEDLELIAENMGIDYVPVSTQKMCTHTYSEFLLIRLNSFPKNMVD